MERPYKKPPKPALSLRRKTNLQKGDVIAYQLGSTYSEEIVKNVFESKPQLNKKWALLCVIDKHTKPVTKIMPELDYETFAIITVFDKLFDEKPLFLPSGIRLRKIISKNCAGEPEEYDAINLDDEILKRHYKYPANIELIGKYYTAWSIEEAFDGTYRDIDHSLLLMF